MHLKMLPKFLIIMITITVVPLLVLGLFSLDSSKKLGYSAADNARIMGEASVKSAKEIGTIATNDSTIALDELAQESIEVRAMTIANQVADFLYERDSDVLLAKALPQNSKSFQKFIDSKSKKVIHNDNEIEEPIFIEIAQLNSNGKPTLKVIADGFDGKDFKQDDYKSQIESLENGKIYVSNLWGNYIKESEAYSGIEKPDGIRYKGYFRFVTPIFEGDNKTGYLSLKLNSRHIMEIVDHISPTDERFVNLPDAPSGNYSYLVDSEGWLISHPREYHIKGIYDDGKLVNPLDKDENAPKMRDDSKPLQFGHLSGFSKELNEIHTIYATNGESGSQIYPWAGLTKWIAYSVIPYHTGSNYNEKIGFGWVAVGADIDKFHEPALATSKKINSITDTQASEISKSITDTEKNIKLATESLDTTNTIFYVTIITIIIVLIVSFYLSRSLTRPIKQLTEVANRISNGDIDAKIPKIKTNDEIKDLGESLESAMVAIKFLMEKAESEDKK